MLWMYHIWQKVEILTSAFCHREKIKVHFSPSRMKKWPGMILSWVEMYITTVVLVVDEREAHEGFPSGGNYTDRTWDTEQRETGHSAWGHNGKQNRREEH